MENVTVVSDVTDAEGVRRVTFSDGRVSVIPKRCVQDLEDRVAALEAV